MAGTEEAIESALGHTYDIINACIKAFLSLLLEELKDDRNRFKEELDHIGAIRAISLNSSRQAEAVCPGLPRNHKPDHYLSKF